MDKMVQRIIWRIIWFEYLFVYSMYIIKNIMERRYKKLYVLENENIDENTNMNSFIFCWKNWSYYFSKNISKECELLKDVELTTEYDEKKFIDLDYDNKWVFLQTI